MLRAISPTPRVAILALALATAMLGACGIKGPLRLPPPAPVTPATAPPATPATTPSAPADAPAKAPADGKPAQ
jgi:predicted small lipoprotein YifL